MIKTPPGWGAAVLTRAYESMTAVRPGWTERESALPAVQRLHVSDLQWALKRGIEDFGASRTDVIFLCVIYPLLGLLLARVASGYQMLPLVFPLASGFALIGPLAAVGLNEMSRRRELGLSAGLADAFSVFRSPAIFSIILLGIGLVGSRLPKPTGAFARLVGAVIVACGLWIAAMPLAALSNPHAHLHHHLGEAAPTSRSHAS